MPKTVMLNLSDIIHKFDVRTAIDDDRVIQFAVLYETGADVPPVKVMEIDDGKYAFIDGRHRALARAFSNYTDIEAIIAKYENPADIYADALRANYGGAKPPTRADISYTITRMLEAGVSARAVADSLDFLPKSSVRTFIESAKGNISKRRVQGALEAIADGIPLEDAASKFRVKPDDLKERIKGNKKKFGGNYHSTEEIGLVANYKAYISKELRSANSGIAKRMDIILKKIEDGEISAPGALTIIQAWHEHLRKTMIRVEDWRARIDALGESKSKLYKESTVEPVHITRVQA